MDPISDCAIAEPPVPPPDNHFLGRARAFNVIDEIQAFKYRKRRLLGFVLAAAFTAVTTYISAVSVQREPVEQYLPVLLVFVPVTLVVIAAAVFAYRDIVISLDGIRRPYLGLRGRLVRWDNVVRITCGLLSSDETTVDSYFLQTREGIPIFGVSIFSVIDDAERLISAVNIEVGRRKLPVTAWRANEKVALEHLPKPRVGKF